MALTKHIHADIIHAYAEGSTIEVRSNKNYSWEVVEYPSFFFGMEYRIKPVADIVLYSKISDCNTDGEYAFISSARNYKEGQNLKLTFDPFTFKIKSAEKI